ncbi:myosin light chain kinase, smooth muscle-like [Thalassophryne amazonica]|uniref:myosin light chain kinase, smooth muscle-like n=1 Tax=Thalassophryne amazonica TaxID=390379 RepID=UPI001470ACAB|nr:myosin light chain kinase, smooth muscle-like [Thalassophryne amazonica]
MDFKANLKGVKAKTEEERKVNSLPQVDFRAVLAKKGGSAANNSKPAETPKKSNSADFRSVLANKKKNGESGKAAVKNCVDGDVDGGGGGQPPEFVEKLSDTTVLEGQRLHLQCRLRNFDPEAAGVTWTLDGKLIKPSKFIILTTEGQRSCTHAHMHAPAESDVVYL